MPFLAGFGFAIIGSMLLLRNHGVPPTQQQLRAHHDSLTESPSFETGMGGIGKAGLDDLAEMPDASDSKHDEVVRGKYDSHAFCSPWPCVDLATPGLMPCNERATFLYSFLKGPYS